jgi:hypothetical protein
MEKDVRDQQRKGYTMMRSVYDIGVGVFITIIGVIMLFGGRLGIPALTEFIEDRDSLLLGIFGGLCLLYGIFRLYRGVKKNY